MDAKVIIVVKDFLVKVAKKLAEDEKVKELAKTLADGVFTKLLEWIRDVVAPKTAKAIENAAEGIVYGFRLAGQKIKNKCRQCIRKYSKKNDKWYETTTTRVVGMKDVPEKIQSELNGEEETDVSERLEAMLEN